jgi:hypothetical protein
VSREIVTNYTGKPGTTILISGYVPTNDVSVTNARPPTAHNHAAADTTNLQSTVAGYGYTTASTATGIAQGVIVPYTNHQDRTDNPHSTTAAQIGAVTGTPWAASTWESSNILASIANGTCTLTSAMGPYLYLIPTNPVVITADSTLTSTNVVANFVLDLYSGAQQVTWNTAAITNWTTLYTNAWNSRIFHKGYGASVLQGVSGSP